MRLGLCPKLDQLPSCSVASKPSDGVLKSLFSNNRCEPWTQSTSLRFWYSNHLRDSTFLSSPVTENNEMPPSE